MTIKYNVLAVAAAEDQRESLANEYKRIKNQKVQKSCSKTSYGIFGLSTSKMQLLIIIIMNWMVNTQTSVVQRFFFGCSLHITRNCTDKITLKLTLKSVNTALRTLQTAKRTIIMHRRLHNKNIICKHTTFRPKLSSDIDWDFV